VVVHGIASPAVAVSTLFQKTDRPRAGNIEFNVASRLLASIMVTHLTSCRLLYLETELERLPLSARLVRVVYAITFEYLWLTNL